MKKGQELKVELDKVTIYHQNLPKKQLKQHCHDSSHLFIPIHGDIWITIDDKRHRVTPGKMMVVASNKMHSFESQNSQGERLVLFLNKKITKSSIVPKSNLIQELIFHVLINSKTKTTKNAVSLIFNLIDEVLLSPQINSEALFNKAKDERVEKSLRSISKNLELSISEIARQNGITSKTLSRLFLKDLECTPKQAQTTIRIEKAQELILKKNMNITEVAFSVGFNSLSSFIANYRSVTGKLPSKDR